MAIGLGSEDCTPRIAIRASRKPHALNDFQTATLPAGRHRVRVVYLGSTDFRQSRSAIWIERVGASRSDAPPADHSRDNIAVIAGTP